jgi:hypothetical protein
MPTPRVPDLWKRNVDKADAFYSMLLIRLAIKDKQERIIQVCRTIRRHAAKGPGSKAALFTFMFERDALVELGKFQLALRQAHLRDRIYHGKRPDYRQVSSSNLDPMETYWLIYTLAPLHYCNGHYETARQLLELGLGFWLNTCKQISYFWFWKVAPSRASKLFTTQVSLTQIYRKLDRDLQPWSDWERFAQGFTPKFYHTLGITGKQLSADATLLKDVAKRIREMLAAGLPCDFSPPAKITGEETPTTEKQRQERREETNRKLKEFFPELR